MQKHKNMNNSLLKITFLVLLTFYFPMFCVQVGADNLIQNPSFESGAEGAPFYWQQVSRKTENYIEWTTEDVHSGVRAMRIFSSVPEDPGMSMGVYTDFIAVPENVEVELTTWLKGKDIISEGGWYKGRIVLYMYDGNKNKIIHKDLQLDGTIADWKEIKLANITPEGTRFLRIAFFLTSCTGTIWIDDAELNIISVPPVVDLTGLYNPIIIPNPWKVNFGNKSFLIGSLAIVIDDILGDQNNLKEEMKEFFVNIGLTNFKFLTEGDIEINQYNSVLLVGDLEHTLQIVKQFQKIFPNNTAQEIGSQGYFLSASEEKLQNIIYLSANTEQGRFYGFQSFKQAIDIKTEPKAYALDILDAPTLGRRGIVMGVQWFSMKNEAISRLAGLKENYVVNQGSFMNYKFAQNWRDNFTLSELSTMEAYLALCKKHFVVPHLNFGPRSSDPKIDPVTFSSNDEISIVVEKVKKLYAIGFRNFGLNFDDLQNVGQEILLVDKDKSLFENNIGKAHSFFTQSIYNLSKENCPEIEFSVLPMYYNDSSCISDKQQAYLSEFASLPPQVKLVACTITDEGILKYTELTNRTITIWSNFFAYFQSPSFSEEYTWPVQNNIGWNSFNIKSSIDAFIFLPIVPAYEDPSIVSWKTAADYMWSPVRYIAINSFQNAMGQFKGVIDRTTLRSPENLRILE